MADIGDCESWKRLKCFSPFYPSVTPDNLDTVAGCRDLDNKFLAQLDTLNVYDLYRRVYGGGGLT